MTCLIQHLPGRLLGVWLPGTHTSGVQDEGGWNAEIILTGLIILDRLKAQVFCRGPVMIYQRTRLLRSWFARFIVALGVPSVLLCCVHTSDAEAEKSQVVAEDFHEEALFTAYRPSYQQDYKALKARFEGIHNAVVAQERRGVPIWCMEQMEDEATIWLESSALLEKAAERMDALELELSRAQPRETDEPQGEDGNWG